MTFWVARQEYNVQLPLLGCDVCIRWRCGRVQARCRLCIRGHCGRVWGRCGLHVRGTVDVSRADVGCTSAVELRSNLWQRASCPPWLLSSWQEASWLQLWREFSGCASVCSISRCRSKMPSFLNVLLASVQHFFHSVHSFLLCELLAMARCLLGC